MLSPTLTRENNSLVTDSQRTRTGGAEGRYCNPIGAENSTCKVRDSVPPDQMIVTYTHTWESCEGAD